MQWYVKSYQAHSDLNHTFPIEVYPGILEACNKPDLAYHGTYKLVMHPLDTHKLNCVWWQTKGGRRESLGDWGCTSVIMCAWSHIDIGLEVPSLENVKPAVFVAHMGTYNIHLGLEMLGRLRRRVIAICRMQP